jgi:hypothetical protein
MRTNVPVYVESSTPLDLPSFCMACGRDTRHKVSLNADSHKRNVALGCLLHLTMLGLVFEAIRMLTQKRVRVPICWHCHMRSFVPDPKLNRKVWLFIAMLCGGFILFNIDHPGFGTLTLLLSLTVLIPLVRENKDHARKYLPIEVSYSNGQYHYAVYSGPFRQFLIDQGVEHKLVVEKNRPQT